MSASPSDRDDCFHIIDWGEITFVVVLALIQSFSLMVYLIIYKPLLVVSDLTGGTSATKWVSYWTILLSGRTVSKTYMRVST